MAISFKAKVKVFEHDLELTPNTQVPSRIEVDQTFSVESNDILSHFPIPEDFTAPLANLQINVNHVLIDTQNHDFQLAVDIKPDQDYFLNKYPSVLEIKDLYLFLSCTQSSGETGTGS